MQSTWANFAKNPQAGPGWDKVGSAKGAKDLGEFKTQEGLVKESSEFVDRWCHHWEMGNMI
jgi:hypothetical protein